MPKSKRNKVVNLTKVKKKGRAAKEDLVSNVQEALESYKNSYVVSYENMRAGPFKNLAKDMSEDSKFFLGKNKVMGVALGRTPEDEHADNSHLLTRYLRGEVCMLFSDRTKEQLEKTFEDQVQEDYAKAGQPASYTVHLEKGTDALEGYGHSMEPHFRQLGLPTKLNF